ncbi:E3 ubiquitin-protein ligase At1g63170-like [Rhododendron vialii]|uniref:E3 ubiquitin-protein ligase At1g63170-like n=1 Tax=Rhododendron vialii TaxID=182163 RepID=UPI00265DCFCA|nr:E3 ubiquitin-protein ligase At1g63170-like [Rhododendron vialii]XP_058206798.1 E3 ubiquitin-protein ligase At1g63170-like [Rhododendron vialii]XP_058206799.1 E3 ubiquitin-protein ligase At1g63170-like [Rhododendron vialii]
MAVSMQEPRQENTTDSYPLLMEPQENNENQEHLIDIERGSDASSSGSSQNGSPRGSTLSHREDRPSSSIPIPITQLPSLASNSSNSRSSPTTRRGEGSGRRHWSPFNTVLWLSIELVFTLGQIIAAIVVLAISGHENPQTPLFAWIVGYAVGCAASLPIIYWRYLHCNQGAEQGSARLRQGSSQGNTTPEPNSYITISLARNAEEEAGQNTSSGIWNGQRGGAPNARLSVVMDQSKMALDCFFAVWFVVGNVWIFGGHSSSSDAPNLYRLCIVFLTFSCIGYAMPFILCSMICCCLPCIISILGVRDDVNGMRGATEEIINALPTHKFKSKEKESHSSRDSNSGVEEGGFLAAGTEKERVISGEDAVCCICLARYADNDELRELPCSHFFHTECVDKWLKINASCPLCKFEIVDTNENSPPPADSTQQV